MTDSAPLNLVMPDAGARHAGDLAASRRAKAQGLHIAALAVSLKVPVRKLEALEADRLDLLPDAVFVRALASSVCRTLKMDPAPVLERLPQTAAPRLVRDSGGINTPFRAPSDGRNPSWFDQLSKPVFLAVFALLLGALVLIFLPSARQDDAAAPAKPEVTSAAVPASPVAAPEAAPAMAVVAAPVPAQWVVWGQRVVTVGGDAPVRVQSMTNTDTADAIGTAIQVKELAWPAPKWCASPSTRPRRRRQVPHIREQLDRMGIDVPLIGDFHYNGHRLLTDYPDCAEALSKYRINPGQRGQGRQARPPVRPDDRGRHALEQAGAHRCQLGQPGPGTAGQPDGREQPRAQPWDARRSCTRRWCARPSIPARGPRMGMDGNQIILSPARSAACRTWSRCTASWRKRCDYALHLGLTEAGMGTKGTVASAAALSILLQEGIGDTIRVSLTPAARRGAHPGGGDRVRDPAGTGAVRFVPSVTACPGCGRTTSTTFQELASRSTTSCARRCRCGAEVPRRRKDEGRRDGLHRERPGESKHADIGISLPGTGEAPAAPVFIDGEKAHDAARRQHRHEFHQIVENYIEKRFGAPAHGDRRRNDRDRDHRRRTDPGWPKN
jgi:(E)-4-hydroxy-3-methylbut-2-enyl-diphosphate synthase